MSKDLPQQPQQSEEVELGQLFKAIGSLFEKLFTFIGSIFKTVFSLIIYAAKAILANFKVIAIAVVLAGIVGFVLQRAKPTVYESTMLVKPYFDSKFQLITNINYFNALIADKDYDMLGNIFEIENEVAHDIIEFEIDPGPETENDRILEFEEFIAQIDSTRAENISFDDFINNRSIYSGDLYEINVKSFKKDIFVSLEEGLNSSFTNTFSIRKREKRDSLLAIDRSRILNSLKEVDSLQNVYINVLKDESKNENQGTVTLKDGMSLVQERIRTKEYELLEKEIELRQELATLESKKVEEDEYFETLSSFQEVGSEHISFLNRYIIIFPILAFLLLVVVYSTRKFITFIKNYED